MERLLPFFEVSGPTDEQFTVELTKERMTIGRFELYNDIALEPDPQEHKLFRYMDQRNRSNGNMPVMCTFEELQAALWG